MDTGGGFVIDRLWMGHGHTNRGFPYPNYEPPHRVEAYALNVETIPGPIGDQIMLSVRYREHAAGGGSYEQTSGPWDLRQFLEQAFAPSP
ncbi:MAG TPA: hypothetical protein EYQ54_02520 [Myxococcales bacterium]|nr:hypothetical protein [Myxococcales bacterium]HIL81554.1 hypothetical protein [Myxococcales bacterium]